MFLSLDHSLKSVCDLVSQWPTVPILMCPSEVSKCMKFPSGTVGRHRQFGVCAYGFFTKVWSTVYIRL